jgi:hypothetical protein
VKGGPAHNGNPAAARPEAPLRAALELAALGAGLTLTVSLMAALPSWYQDLGTFQSLEVVAFVFFAIALARLPRYSAVPRAGLAVAAVALATRAALFPVTPTLSGDVYRYVWEGRVLAAGGDPYRQPPLDPALVHLRDREIYPGVNHKDLATIYPPLAEAGFALVAATSPTVHAMKLWNLLHELGLMVCLAAMLRSAGIAPVALVAYAWNPLVLIEFAGTGHNDPTAMVWLALAIHLAKRRPVLSAVALAVGVMVKLVPLLALPFLVRHWTWRARAIGVALLAAGLAWFWLLTRGGASGLDAYAGRWRNNELAFLAFERLLGGFDAARVAVAAVVAALVAAALWRGWDSLRGSRAVVRAAALLSPVVHPWYLGWPLLFEPFGPSIPWCLLSLTASLNYGVFGLPPEGRAFHLPLAWRWIEYGLPLVAALLLAGWRRARGPEARST